MIPRQDPDPSVTAAPLQIREIGSFFTGGRIVTVSGCSKRRVQVARNGPDRIVDLNGDYVTGQCYAHFTRLARPRYDTPVMFWHGGAMTGVTWETTPDGRPGWQMFFLREGFDVFICDALERGRAGWSPYPDVYSEAPIFRTQNEAWALFRMGPDNGYHTDPALRRVFPGQQFPVEFFDRFGAQFVPRWTNHGDETLDSYYRVLEHTGPVVLIAHSQGANLALEAAQTRPDLIRRVVVIEPAAAPKCDPADLSQATRVPHLFVWGDFCDKAPLWGDYRSVVEAYARALRDAGGIADTLDLPVEGLSGNSHVPMMDRNSDQVAALVTRWIATNVRPMPPVDATPPMPRHGFP